MIEKGVNNLVCHLAVVVAAFFCSRSRLLARESLVFFFLAYVIHEAIQQLRRQRKNPGKNVCTSLCKYPAGIIAL